MVLTNTNKSSYSYNCPESCLCGKAFSHASHIKTARNSERTVSAMAVLWVAGAAHAEDFRGKTRYRWLIIRGITAKQQKMRSMLSGGKRESLRGRRRHRSAARGSADRRWRRRTSQPVRGSGIMSPNKANRVERLGRDDAADGLRFPRTRRRQRDPGVKRGAY